MTEMNDLFLRACRGEQTSRIPIWVMRQAGRYLPEYREVRSKVDFLTLCRTPELAAEVTIQPIDRYGFDAAILFSDIMTPLESMGVELTFSPGPHVAKPIASPADVERMRVPEQEEITPFVIDAVRILARELANRVPLIGFAGAPLTLAAYLVEGKGSKDFNRLRSFIAAEPEAATLLLDRLATVMGRYLRAQVEAGAQAVQLFDSWAGILAEREYRRFALPAVQKVLAALDGLDVPKIFFAQDAAAFFPLMTEAGADVIGVDWRLDLRDARKMLGGDFVLQGNLDPAVLRAPKDVIAREARRVLENGGGTRHIFNLGHGILPDIPLDHVHALVDTVREFSPQEIQRS
jgi:uroporphyrinogen decarboxylase